MCYEPICTGKVNGIYQDTTAACRRYYTCSGGKLTDMENCSLGQLHDGYSCQPQNEVSCDSPETSAISYPFLGDKRCKGREDGNYGIEDNACQKYIVCSNEETVNILECANGYRFNARTKDCVPLSEMPYCFSNSMGYDDDLCFNSQDGLRIDPSSTDCKDYLKCLNKKLISKHSCGPSTVFNGISCVPETIYQCPTTYFDLCRKKANGLYLDPRIGCQNYVKCVNQIAVQMLSCTANEYFDESNNSCVLNVNGKLCSAPEPSMDCSELTTGYYQNRKPQSSCSDYYYCFNGLKTKIRCQSGRVFDGENCVDEKFYTCPNLAGNSCDNKLDGYYKDESLGCRAYYYCSGGKKFSYLCGENQLWDGSKCVENHNRQQCNDNDNDCDNRSNGYYQDTKSGCRDYYFCTSGAKVQLLTCRGSKIFNGNSCVPQSMYSCPNTKSIGKYSNCLQTSKCFKECKKDGFYLNIESQCKSYYFCIGGVKSILTCSSNFVFNGEICVPSHTFQCPTQCNHESSIKCANAR